MPGRWPGTRAGGMGSAPAPAPTLTSSLLPIPEQRRTGPRSNPSGFSQAAGHPRREFLGEQQASRPSRSATPAAGPVLGPLLPPAVISSLGKVRERRAGSSLPSPGALIKACSRNHGRALREGGAGALGCRKWGTRGRAGSRTGGHGEGDTAGVPPSPSSSSPDPQTFGSGSVTAL